MSCVAVQTQSWRVSLHAWLAALLFITLCLWWYLEVRPMEFAERCTHWSSQMCVEKSVVWRDTGMRAFLCADSMLQLSLVSLDSPDRSYRIVWYLSITNTSSRIWQCDLPWYAMQWFICQCSGNLEVSSLCIVFMPLWNIWCIVLCLLRTGSLPPLFSPSILPWMSQGSVYRASPVRCGVSVRPLVTWCRPDLQTRPLI